MVRHPSEEMMAGEGMRARSGQIRAGLLGLMVGLIGISGPLWPGRGMAVGPSLHCEATHGQTEVQVVGATAQVVRVTATEGQKVDVPGTELTVAVKAVKDFTSGGCLG